MEDKTILNLIKLKYIALFVLFAIIYSILSHLFNLPEFLSFFIGFLLYDKISEYYITDKERFLFDKNKPELIKY